MENAQAKILNIGYDKSISKIAEGNLSALSELYIKLKKPVFILALSIVRDYPMAEDIMQETFVKVASNVDNYRKGTNAKAWILSITRNMSLDYLKKRKKEDITDEITVPSNSKFEEEIASTIEFQKMIEPLDEIEKQIIVLHITAGIKHKQIGKVLELTTENVRTKYSRAIKKLKAIQKNN